MARSPSRSSRSGPSAADLDRAAEVATAVAEGDARRRDINEYRGIIDVVRNRADYHSDFGAKSSRSYDVARGVTKGNPEFDPWSGKATGTAAQGSASARRDREQAFKAEISPAYAAVLARTNPDLYDRIELARQARQDVVVTGTHRGITGGATMFTGHQVQLSAKQGAYHDSVGRQNAIRIGGTDFYGKSNFGFKPETATYREDPSVKAAREQAQAAARQGRIDRVVDRATYDTGKGLGGNRGPAPAGLAPPSRIDVPVPAPSRSFLEAVNEVPLDQLQEMTRDVRGGRAPGGLGAAATVADYGDVANKSFSAPTVTADRFNEVFTDDQSARSKAEASLPAPMAKGNFSWSEIDFDQLQEMSREVPGSLSSPTFASVARDGTPMPPSAPARSAAGITPDMVEADDLEAAQFAERDRLAAEERHRESSLAGLRNERAGTGAFAQAGPRDLSGGPSTRPNNGGAAPTVTQPGFSWADVDWDREAALVNSMVGQVAPAAAPTGLSGPAPASVASRTNFDREDRLNARDVAVAASPKGAPAASIAASDLPRGGLGGAAQVVPGSDSITARGAPGPISAAERARAQDEANGLTVAVGGDRKVDRSTILDRVADSLLSPNLMSPRAAATSPDWAAPVRDKEERAREDRSARATPAAPVPGSDSPSARGRTGPAPADVVAAEREAGRLREVADRALAAAAKAPSYTASAPKAGQTALDSPRERNAAGVAAARAGGTMGQLSQADQAKAAAAREQRAILEDNARQAAKAAAAAEKRAAELRDQAARAPRATAPAPAARPSAAPAARNSGLPARAAAPVAARAGLGSWLAPGTVGPNATFSQVSRAISQTPAGTFVGGSQSTPTGIDYASFTDRNSDNPYSFANSATFYDGISKGMDAFMKDYEAQHGGISSGGSSDQSGGSSGGGGGGYDSASSYNSGDPYGRGGAND